jgi:hypothetical protein
VAYSHLEQSTDLYSIDFVDIIHVGQATHQLPDNSVKPRAKASAGYNACFHFIRLKVNLTRFKYKYLCQPMRYKCGQQPTRWQVHLPSDGVLHDGSESPAGYSSEQQPVRANTATCKFTINEPSRCKASGDHFTYLLWYSVIFIDKILPGISKKRSFSITDAECRILTQMLSKKLKTKQTICMKAKPYLTVEYAGWSCNGFG